jgi:ADP-L-glycero-D-manno-heptose 6-epimerase
MASVAMHFFDQYRSTGKVRLFAGSDGYGDGEQRRDFVSIDDVVSVNLHFLGGADASGIYNCGTGRAQTFNDVAVATINACRAQQGEAALSLDAMRAAGLVEYFPMPADLARKYQSFTEADLSLLRRTGYAASFAGVAEGVVRYVDHLARAA